MSLINYTSSTRNQIKQQHIGVSIIIDHLDIFRGK